MGFHVSLTILNPLLVLTLCTLGFSKECVQRERIALLDFKTSLTTFSQNYDQFSSWNTSEDCCSWDGITCDSTGHVVVLDLFCQAMETTTLSIDNFQRLSHLCSLKKLNASGCRIEQRIVDVLQALSGCASDSLETLDLSSNNLAGTIPPMLKFRSLQTLSLDYNRLEGFTDSTRRLLFPATLSNISVSGNNLSGVLLSEYFTNLSQLTTLDFSNHPNLTISFNEPPAEVKYIHLSWVNLGPKFPTWITALNSLVYLDISHSNISGAVPDVFWRSLSLDLYYIDLSSNNLNGVVPNIGYNFYDNAVIDLSSNAFCGPIPSVFLNANVLQLSKNNFSSFAPPQSPDLPFIYKTLNRDPVYTSPVYRSPTSTLDISDNNLSGKIPEWVESELYRYSSLNLANNNLSGIIPSSIGDARHLYVLNLRNNSFFGPLPPFLQSCNNMTILDLSRNKLSGLLPSWLGKGLKSLVALSLQSNNFVGTLPENLCRFGSLQILDLSNNKLSGDLPSCIFVAMARKMNLSLEIRLPINGNGAFVPIEEAEFFRAFIKWKGMDRLFQKSLELLRLIDLSNNNLSGEIPTDLISLVELDSLDLSCNAFHGSIPNQIGQLKSLEYLNMSYNKLSGPIPPSLSDISSLGVLDLSYNNLSGRIPEGTQLQGFNSSAFAGNLELCGLPLQVKCPGDVDDSSAKALQPSATYESDKEYKREDKLSFYAGLGAGFACGFFGILGSLFWIRKWRYAFFQTAARFGEWILLVVALSTSKITRKLWLK